MSVPEPEQRVSLRGCVGGVEGMSLNLAAESISFNY